MFRIYLYMCAAIQHNILILILDEQLVTVSTFKHETW